MSMALSSSRGVQALVRQSRQSVVRSAARRFESTNAEKATEAAKNIQSKASEGLSRAGPAISGAAKGLGNALSKIGGRTGRFISFVERELLPAMCE